MVEFVKVRRLLLFSFILLCVLGILLIGKSRNRPISKITELHRLFPNEGISGIRFHSRKLSSPLLYTEGSDAQIIVAVSDGTIVALHPKTGEASWMIKVPVPDQERPYILATPVIVGNKLVVAYQTQGKRAAKSQRLAVIDLDKGNLDDNFSVIEFSAEKLAADGKQWVKFNAESALAHASLVYVPTDNGIGLIYVSFGGIKDIQPWHGWMFEVDMKNWLESGPDAAISSALITTPEPSCPVEGMSGARNMICGGGIWSPAGPQVSFPNDEFELLVPTGNGQLDLERKDYANTLMKLARGLEFDPGCDEELCSGFNPVSPDRDCIRSCENLFIPRLMPGDPPLSPSSGVCDNKTFWECLAWNDYDLGANSPATVKLNDELSVIVQPGKEGGVYLIDAENLGVLYDRKQVVDICGTKEDECRMDWAGMIVTQPAITMIGDTPIAILPTFMPDRTHPAGLIALKIIIDRGRPVLRSFWQIPEPTSNEAIVSFRSHPSRVVINFLGKNQDAYAWVIDADENGKVWGVRVKDGKVVVRSSLLGVGLPHTLPLIYDNVLYVPSRSSDSRFSWVEAYDLSVVASN